MRYLLNKNLLILLFVFILLVLPFFLVKKTTLSEGEELFLGTDDKAKSLIKELSPNYKPWFTSVFEPPSGEISSLLFSLQAAIGAGFIGYYFGFSRGRKSIKIKEE
ncbi:MAG: energy-coupling factor ABC transporter substrate-binding protein [Oligoflexia bacterium]|nr:energy-coupling factor ABC transporter substrate-binding protein [Oligoflexia bacterium]